MAKIFCFIITLFMSLFTEAIENKFTGTWELISGEYLNNKGELVQYKSLEMKSIKVISATHFSFVSMSGSKFWSSGVGRYRFTASEYIESPIHTSYGVTLGKEYVFTYKIDKNFWYNSRWEHGKRVEHEVWKKTL